MKTILVTGCSHTAGVEMSDTFVFEDYKKYLKNVKNLTKTEDQMFRVRQQINFIWKNFNSKRFKNYVSTDTLKAGNIASKFCTLLDKTHSWPAVLQNKLPEHKVINLAWGGNSFKLNIKNALDFMKKHNSELIVIHQVPHYSRTYFKHNDKIHNVVNLAHLEHTKNIIQNSKITHTTKILEQKYKNLVKRDVKHNYFAKALSRYLECLIKNSNKSIQHFFILENVELKHIFPKQNIIIEDFKEFRKNYQMGESHIIDPKFQKDVADLIISKLQLKKPNKINTFNKTN
tara:strand:- start:15 stop:875 length:861 start_codon:yes stop_codon:yes gene_type:complete